MSRAKTRLVALLLVLGITSAAGAQPPQGTVTMSADRTTVDVGETIRLTIQADITGARSASIEPPDLSAFDVVNRSTSQSAGFGFGMGASQATIIHRLTLRTRQPGTFRIEPAAVVVPGGRIESEPLTIQVGGVVTDPGAQPSPASEPPSATGIDGTVFDPGGFVRTVVDQSAPYVGQQVTVTVYLYSRETLHGGLTITQEPTADGFWVHDLLPPSRALEGQLQTVRGIPFTVYVLRRFAAFPLRDGELTIGPTSVSVTSGGFFGSIFGGGASPPTNRTGVPVTVQVRPLPTAGRPTGEVHVGSLELSAELDRDQVATGDAVQLTVTARGSGHLQQVDVASPSASGLRVLQPEIDDQVGSPRDVVGGARTFRWLIVPEREGAYALGPFEVHVFDPQSGTYSVARANALRLTAAGNPTPSAAEAPAEQPDTESDEEDALTLGPIRSRSSLLRGRSTLLDAPWLPFGFGAGPLILLGVLLVRAARRRGNGGPDDREKRARRDAKRRLAAAGRHAGANEPREFYGAIAQSLKEVLEAKLGRAVGSLTHAELRRVLTARAMDEELANRVVDELEGCDFARFSAAGIRGEEMERCLARAKALLEELDRFTPSREEEA